MAKLSEFLPDVPEVAKTIASLNEQINMLQLSKAAGDTGQAPTIGLDHVVNTWVRHQMAYRQQLVMDLQTITYSVQEIRGPLTHITGEVFRRGMKIKPKVKDPDKTQLVRFSKFLTDSNVFDQSLEEVLRQFHYDLNSIDDAFLYLAKEYEELPNGKLGAKVKEIRRLNPALVEFDLDAAGLPKNAHFLCPIDRTDVAEEPGMSKKGYKRIPAMYKYYHRNQHMYLADSEVIHLSKFSPSETYGWSPILTVFEKALTLIGMDKNLYRYFFERKMPASMIMVTTDDPESLRRERAHIAAQTRLDPNFIPMVAVSSRNNRGRVDMVRLFHTLQEMDYLPVKQEIRERIASMWGVSPTWQGTPEAFGGMSATTQNLTVMSRVVESDQRLFHEKVFPELLKAFGVTDYEIELPRPEEKADATIISHTQQKVAMASQLSQLGFTVELKEKDETDMLEIEFVVSGDAVPTAKMQGEQQAMQLEQQQQQIEQSKQQAEMAQMQAAIQEGADEEPTGEEDDVEKMEKGYPFKNLDDFLDYNPEEKSEDDEYSHIEEVDDEEHDD